jgi:hypothetical protein
MTDHSGRKKNMMPARRADAGSWVEVIDDPHATRLHAWAYNGYPEAVKKCLDEGEDPWQRTDSGYLPIDMVYLSEPCAHAVVELLMEAMRERDPTTFMEWWVEQGFKGPAR